MKTKHFLLALLFVMSLPAGAQKTIKLWNGNPPTSNEITTPENVNESHWITNVSVPELTIYIPSKTINNGKALVD